VKLFLSWSGAKSHAVAKALYEWIPSVLQAVEPWMSSEDVEKGSRWSQHLGQQLAETDFGIICVTKENQHAAWILFEAGALSKSLAAGSVATFLLDMKSSDVVGPLAQFQDTKPDAPDVLKLIETINRRLTPPRPQARLAADFEVWWSQLDAKLKSASKISVTRLAERDEREMLEEVLIRIRTFERSFEPIGISSPSFVGIDRIVPSWDAIDWDSYLQSTLKLDMLVRDGNPWREQNEAALRMMVQREEVHVRVVFPDPNDEAVLMEANRAHQFALDEARERIKRSVEGFTSLRDGTDVRGKVEIYFSRQVPLYAWCRMDGVGMLRPYAHRPHPEMPALLLKESGSFYQICQADFEMLVERAVNVSRSTRS
jgi:hypothetical protein